MNTEYFTISNKLPMNQIKQFSPKKEFLITVDSGFSIGSDNGGVGEDNNSSSEINNNEDYDEEYQETSPKNNIKAT